MKPSAPLLAMLPLGFRLAGLALGYFLLSQFAFLISPPGQPCATFWPASGLLLAALVTHEYQAWPWFLLVAFPASLAAHLLRQTPIEASLTYALANIAAPLFGAWMFQACSVRCKQDRSRLCRALCLIIFSAGAGSALASSIHTTSMLWFSGGESYVPVWITNWAGDAIGMLSAAPVLLAWLDMTPEDFTRDWSRRTVETLTICASTGLFTWLVMTNRLFPTAQIAYYLLLPVLAWALVRLNPPGVALVGFILSAVALASIENGASLVWAPSTGASLSSAHVYLISALPTLLILSETLAERKTALKDLEYSRASLRAMLDNMPYLAWLKDSAGRYLAVNQAFARVMETPVEDIIGRTDKDFRPAERAARVQADDAKTLAADGQLYVEERLQTREGRVVWYETYRAPFRDETGTVVGTTGLSREFTSRKLLDEELIRSRVAAEDANQAKSEFLASMSHEIRAPLSGIMGAIRMTLLDDLSPRQRDLMGMALETADSLLSIINDILDFSRIEARRFELTPTDFNLPEVLQRLLNPFCLQADQKGLSLQLSIDPDVPHDLHGDAERLGQVVRNLVSNAIKFTRHGVVKVSVRMAESADQSHRLSFSVSDEGIGIPKDKIPCLFRSFTQVHSDETGGYGGSGLGLAISKRLVELMGGTVGVESTLGQGSTFFFTAWFADSKGGDTGPAWIKAGEAAEPTVALPPLRVLVADDTRLSRMFVTHFLERQGHTTVCVENGREALEAMRRERFDVVLMDVRMPEVDGLQATASIRSDTSGLFDPRIPIIALTAHAMKGDKDRFLSAGMDDYVSKPVDLDELFAVLRRVVFQQTVSGGLGDLALQHGPRHALVLDEEVVKRRFVGNRAFWINLLEELTANQLPVDRQALQQAAQAPDMDAVRKLAHKIKGSCATVGAMPAFAAAQKLESADEKSLDRRMADLEAELDTLADTVRGMSA